MALTSHQGSGRNKCIQETLSLYGVQGTNTPGSVSWEAKFEIQRGNGRSVGSNTWERKEKHQDGAGKAFRLSCRSIKGSPIQRNVLEQEFLLGESCHKLNWLWPSTNDFLSHWGGSTRTYPHSERSVDPEEVTVGSCSHSILFPVS